MILTFLPEHISDTIAAKGRVDYNNIFYNVHSTSSPPAPIFYDLFLFLGAVSIVTTRQPRMPVAGPLPPWVPLTHHWLAPPPFIWAHALIREACVFLLFFLPLSFGNEVCVLLPAVRPAWGASQPPRSSNTLSQIWQQSLVTSHTHKHTHTYSDCQWKWGLHM